jgi:ABC-type transport system involved in cytochrome bd biosynthesis fused ATPase/permease subunit
MKIHDLRLLWRFNESPRLFLIYCGAGLLRSLLIVSQASILATIATSIYLEQSTLQDLVPRLILLLSVTVLRVLTIFALDSFAKKESEASRNEKISTLIGNSLQESTTDSDQIRVRKALTSVSSDTKYLTEYLPNLFAAFFLFVTAILTAALTLTIFEDVAGTTLALLVAILLWEFAVTIRDLGSRPQLESEIQTTSHETDAIPDDDELLKSLGRIKEIRWTDCEIIFNDEKSVTFGWGIAAAGRLTAIVGPTGSGKSTLLRALMRDIPLHEGRFFVDSSKGTYRLEEIDLEYWLDQISWVPSAPYFMPGTIESNLKQIKPRANRERLAEVLKTVHLDVDALPEGLQTPIKVKEGGLTNVQYRQIALARTILKDSVIIVIDASSQDLDPNYQLEEAALLKGLARDGKIIILITNDAESLKLADRKFTFEIDRRPPVRILEAAQ